MQKVKVKILDNSVPAFADTIVGKIYDGYTLETGALVPQAFSNYPGQINEWPKTVQFFDEAGDGVAQPIAYVEGIYLEVIYDEAV